MQAYVADASVILKWVVGRDHEPDHDKAMDLLNAWVEGRIELIAPALWQYEVGNFLGRELSQDAFKTMGLLENLGFQSIGLTMPMCRRCFKWMAESKVTFYDASYLAVAVARNAVLVTADEKFTKKMKTHEHIRLLKDLSLTADL